MHLKLHRWKFEKQELFALACEAVRHANNIDDLYDRQFIEGTGFFYALGIERTIPGHCVGKTDT